MTAQPNIIKVHRPHRDQQEILSGAARFNVVVCGRRFGKTKFALIRAALAIKDGLPVAYFAPTYKMMSEFWRDAVEMLKPAIKSENKAEHHLEFWNGASFSMWSLDSADTVRGRKYALALIDEAAMVTDLENAWNAVIRPTLTDYEGSADFYSTPKGLNYFHSLFMRGCDEAFPDWQSFHYPTKANPYIKESEIEVARLELPEDVFRQEYLAEFIQGEGAVFRNIKPNLVNEKTTPSEHAGHEIVAGVDWGQVNDFTVISVGCVICKREVFLDRFNKIDWNFQRERLIKIIEDWNVFFTLVEENSIGSPNLQELERQGLNVRGWMMTAQNKPKLIQSLALSLEKEEKKFLDIPIATRELEAYEAKKNETTGRIQYNAPSGFHDDTVIARALMNEAYQTNSIGVF